MSRGPPLPALRCPLCGDANDCAPARCGAFEVDCWCRRAAFDAGALARAPDALACLCAACAAGGPAPQRAPDRGDAEAIALRQPPA